MTKIELKWSKMSHKWSKSSKNDLNKPKNKNYQNRKYGVKKSYLNLSHSTEIFD